MKRLLATLKTLNIPVASVYNSPDPQIEDDQINLGGDYVGVHIQVGFGYFDDFLEDTFVDIQTT